MANPVYIVGTTLVFLALFLFIGAFVFPILVGLNIRGSRKLLSRNLNRLPGFRSERRWRIVGSSFVYLIILSFVLFMVGGTLLPWSSGASDAEAPSSAPANGTSTAVLTPTTTDSTTITSTPTTTTIEATKTTAKSTPTSTTASRAPEEVTAIIQSTSDTDRDSGASAFEIVITANTTLKNADSGSVDSGEPYFVIEVDGETMLETDEVERQSEGEFRYQLSEQELRQFEDGELDVTIRLMDEDSLFDDEIGLWSGTVQYDAGQSETSTETSTTTVTPTTTVSQIQTTTDNIQPPAHTPDYEIDSTENLSYLGVVRIEVHVKTEKPVAQLSDAQLRRISQDIVASKAAETKLNAVTVFFWEENAAVGAQQASATVDWAPNGEWSNAGDVTSGDYSTHEYRLERFRTPTPASTSVATTTTETPTTSATTTKSTSNPATTRTTSTTDASSQSVWTVTVLEVVDGDTFEVRFPDGRVEDIRLLGVDTPEVHVENDPAEFEGIPETEDGRDHLRDWGHKASEFARTSLLDEEIRVRVDSTADRRGSYDRLLVYAYHDDGTLFNRQLIEQGYARLYDTEFKKRDAFVDAESRVRSQNVGLWDFEAKKTTTTSDGGEEQNLVVTQVHANAAGNDHENENGEYIVLKNTGESSRDLSDWHLSDTADHTYRFPDGFILGSEETVTLYTGSGTNTDSELYWGSDAAIWDNNGDTIIVRNGGGEAVLKKSY